MYKIDPRLQEPIYSQIIVNIKENIYYERTAPGEKIPSVREMARLLVTNPNTVVKAYKELERENIIEVIQGRGTFIKQEALNNLKADKDEIRKVQKEIKDIVEKSKYKGISKEQLKKWIDEN